MTKPMATMKYFIDRNGVRTQRMAGRPGSGHIEIAQATEQMDPQGDLYDQMFALGYVRVEETDEAVLVDSPRALTTKQKRFLADKASGKQLVVNDPLFIERRGWPYEKARL